MHACMYKDYSEHVTGRVQVCTRAGMYHMQDWSRHLHKSMWGRVCSGPLGDSGLGLSWEWQALGGSWLSRAL